MVIKDYLIIGINGNLKEIYYSTKQEIWNFIKRLLNKIEEINCFYFGKNKFNKNNSIYKDLYKVYKIFIIICSNIFKRWKIMHFIKLKKNLVIQQKSYQHSNKLTLNIKKLRINTF